MGTYEHKEKSNVLIYHDIIDDLDDLADECGHEAVGTLFMAIMHYSRDNDIPTFSQGELGIKFLFSRVKRAIDLDRVKYEERCIRNANNRNGTRGRSDLDNSQVIDSETGEVIEPNSEASSKTQENANVPDLNMVLEYFLLVKKHPLSRQQGEACRDYCVEQSKCTGKPWKDSADVWFNNLSAV